MDGGGGSPTERLVAHAKDGRAFAFCDRCYNSVRDARMHSCIPDETEEEKKPVEKIVFREIYGYENRFVNLKDYAKVGGEKWKSLTEDEKKVYRDKAAELMEKYNKSLESTDADDEEEEDEEKEADEFEIKKDALNGGLIGRGRGRGRGRVRLGRLSGFG